MHNFNLSSVFKRKEPSTRRETRGSSSNQPMRPSYCEEFEPMELIEVGRECDVQPSVYPCHDFLTAAGIIDEFINLVQMQD